MSETREGGCLRGAVRYRVTGAPIVGGAGYCRDCQYTSGGAGAHGVMYPAGALTVTRGRPATHSLLADSGNTVFRQFCPACGVHVTSWNSGAPQMRAVKFGTFDDPSGYRSQGSLFVASAQPWHRPDPDLPQHPAMPCLADPSRGPDGQGAGPANVGDAARNGARPDRASTACGRPRRYTSSVRTWPAARRPTTARAGARAGRERSGRGPPPPSPAGAAP